jgi:hypothetical protein
MNLLLRWNSFLNHMKILLAWKQQKSTESTTNLNAWKNHACIIVFLQYHRTQLSKMVMTFLADVKSEWNTCHRDNTDITLLPSYHAQVGVCDINFNNGISITTWYHRTIKDFQNEQKWPEYLYPTIKLESRHCTKGVINIWKRHNSSNDCMDTLW